MTERTLSKHETKHETLKEVTLSTQGESAFAAEQNFSTAEQKIAATKQNVSAPEQSMPATDSKSLTTEQAVLAAELGKVHQAMSRAITAYAQPLLSKWDLRVLDVILLRIIYQNPGITIMELTNRTGWSQSTVSSRVKRHEQLGFLLKKTNPTDKRSYQLYVRGAVRDVLAEVLQKLDTFFQALVSDLKPGEQQALMTVLPALQAIIKNYSRNRSQA